MNLDFLALNTLGYICYTIYCTYGYFNPQASVETGRVNLNDLLFVYHALAITCVMIVQSWIYPKGKNGVSAKTLGIIIVIVAFSAVYTILVHVLLINNLGSRVNKTRALSISDQFHGIL